MKKLLALALVLPFWVFGQPYPDKPYSAEVVALDAFLEPYRKKAIASYPAAKQRFQSGLPAKQRFFVTTRLKGAIPAASFEQIFVRVSAATDTAIEGTIASTPTGKVAFHAGDKIRVADADVVDWTIVSANGEEGNLLGKAIDAYRADRLALIYKMEIGADGKVNGAELEDVLDSQKQSLKDVTPDDVIGEGRKQIVDLYAGKITDPKTAYTYLFYNLREKRFLPASAPK
jgi:hypothetical protein